MEKDTFQSKRFFKKNTVTLLKTTVLVIKKSPFESQEFEISYEHLETKKTVETKVLFGWLVLFSFMSIMGFLFLFGNMDLSVYFFFFAFISIIFGLTTKLKVVTIKSYDGNNIELYFTHKNKDEVLAFADTIIGYTNSYLLNKFGKIDKDMPVENQLLNLDFLRNKELITEEKFEQLKDHLLGRDNKKSIGYR